MDVSDVIKSLAPTIATALGGPLAGLAVGFISKQFGVDPSKVQETIAGADPVKLKELDLDFQKHLIDSGVNLQLAQIATNTEEAKSVNVFIAGWRPFVGWIGGFALGYSAILEPFARFIAKVGYGYSGEFPVISTDLTMQILMGLLGFAGMRSYEKKNGVESNR